MTRRLRFSCGHQLPALWKIRLDADQAPALQPLLRGGQVRLGDLLRSPEDRDRRLKVVPLLLLHGDDAVLTPDDDAVLAAGDQLLFAGHTPERRALERTLVVDAGAAYVLLDRRIPSSWVWRRLTRAEPLEAPARAASDAGRDEVGTRGG